MTYTSLILLLFLLSYNWGPKRLHYLLRVMYLIRSTGLVFGSEFLLITQLCYASPVFLGDEQGKYNYAHCTDWRNVDPEELRIRAEI